MIFRKSKKNKADTETSLSELTEHGTEDQQEQAAAEPSAGYFQRLKERLSKTRKTFSGGFDKIFSHKQKIDEDLLEELEELLITSDIGVQTALALVEKIASSKIADVDEIKSVLKAEILSILAPQTTETDETVASPRVIMVVGVNGTGKTTTIGKLAARAAQSGQKVLIGAADTFRAAAIDQLMIWAERAKADIVKHQEMADPAAVAYDAVEAAKARGADLVLIDTAGRLHTKVNLMEELKKIKRAISKTIPDAPHEVLLILDATTGQNAISQAELFNNALGVTGLALTKLDGTAKGGIVISICNSLKIPLKYIGIGEQIDDLQKFDAAKFVDALI
ncbi:MAG: signal recognition particle-docking protein FtsY [Deltaproteobacteria bacterium]|jgi:fused signal recognition particle receptor|nr:signal recognition particle-docking protein FtsY [Deltaproteobacteria bacterium]MBW2486444.1 signal recognition particle-docking protein FtsY [Deltaproteobacteria bacterium]